MNFFYGDGRKKAHVRNEIIAEDDRLNSFQAKIDVDLVK